MLIPSESSTNGEFAKDGVLDLTADTELISSIPRVSVVIPTLNEADNLRHVLPRIPSWVHEVILVDGQSTDDTIAVARNLLPDIRVVMQEGRGKGNALRGGFAAATGDIIVTIDADGSMDPGEISTFVSALLAGADYVKGSRFLQGGGTADMSVTRFLGNWVFTTLVRILFGGRYSDLCYGYNAFWSSAVPKIRLDADGFEIETLMNVNALIAKLKVAEVPSFEAERVNGTSRLRALPDGWRVLKTILKARVRQFSRRDPAPVADTNPAYAYSGYQHLAVITSQDQKRAACPTCGK